VTLCQESHKDGRQWLVPWPKGRLPCKPNQLRQLPHLSLADHEGRGATVIVCFEPLGIAPDRAAALADLTISAFEGALVLSRAARSTEPFTTTTEALISAIGHDAASQPAAP
jgi:hypothetical protein